MLRLSIVMAIAMLAFAVAGSAFAQSYTTPADASAGIAAQMTRMTEALEAVQDEASAQAAAATIREINGELGAIKTAVDGMSSADKQAVSMGYATTYADQQGRLSATMMKIAQNPEWMQIISAEMKNTPNLAAQ